MPLVLPGGRTVLEPSMVHSVEPGVYSPEFGGLRVEDDVAVTDAGADVLGRSRGNSADGLVRLAASPLRLPAQ